MTEEQQHRPRELPSDIQQVPTVWRYEMLRYFRSRRLVASFAIVGLVLGLIFIIPIVTGNSYSGTDRDVKIDVLPTQAVLGSLPGGIPGVHLPQAVGFVNRSLVLASTVEVFLDGQPYPSTAGNGSQNWAFTTLVYKGQTANLIFFYQSVAGHNITATYEWRTSTTQFAERFVMFANILVIICATFFAADSISGEYHLRTGYLIFPNPIRRSTLFAGKFLASLTAGVIVVTIFYIVVAILSSIAVKGVDGRFGLSWIFALEYLLATVSVAYLISSVLKGTVGPTVLTFFLFLLILPIIDGVGAISGFKASFSLTFSGGVMQYILVNPYPTDAVTAIPGAGITLHSYYPDVTMAAIIMFLYFVVAVAATIVVFRRKQLLG